MPSIDNRVVNLRFEHKNFESGVAESISALDRLKASLSFEGADEGFRDVEKSINSASFTPLEKNVDSIADRFSNLGIIATSVLANIGTEVYRLGKKIVTAIPNQIMTGGWSRAANIENAKFQLKGLGIAWEDIANQIDYAVSGTAYGLDAAAMAASQLSASNVEFWAGFDPADAEQAAEGVDMMSHALRGISGAAAMTNTSYEEISGIFTAIAGAGKAANGELDRFAVRGLNVRATLASFINDVNSGALEVEDYVWDAVQEASSAFEVTEADVRDLASKGRISFELFASAMDYAFGEHAKDANETFDGAFANMKASLSRIGADFATPIRDGAREIFNAFRLLFNAVRTGTKIDSKTGEVIYDFGNAFGTKLFAEGGFTESFGDAIDFIVDKIMSIDLSWIETLVAIAENLFQSLVNIVVATGPIIDTIRAAWHTIIPEGLGDILVGISEGILNVTTAFRNLFGLGSNEEFDDSPLEGYVEEVDELVETAELVMMTAEQIDEYAGKVIQGMFGVGEARRQALEDLGLSFEAIQNRVNELLGCSFRYDVQLGRSSVTVETLADKLAVLGVSYDSLTKPQRLALESNLDNIDSLEDLREELDKLGIVYDVVPEHVEETNDKLEATAGFLSMISGIVEGIAGVVSIIRQVISGIWNGVLKPLFKTAMMLLDPIFVKIGDIGRKIGELATKWQEEGTIVNWFQNITTWIETAGEKLKEFFANVKELPQVQALLAKWEEIKQWFKDLNIGQWFRDLFSGAKELLPTSDTLLNIVAGIAGGILWIIQTIQGAWPTIKGFFEGLDFSGFKSLWNGLSAFFGHLDFSGVSNFLVSLAEGLGGLVFGIIGTLIDLLGTIDFEKVGRLIGNFFIAVWDGLVNLASHIDLKKIGTALLSVFTMIWNGIVNFFSGIDLSMAGTAISNFFGMIWNGLIGFLGSIDLGEISHVISMILKIVLETFLSTTLFSISRFFFNLNQSLNAFSHALDAAAILMLAGALLSLAIAFGVIAVSIWLLSKVPADKAQEGLNILMTALMSFALVLFGIYMIVKSLGQTGLMTYFKSFTNNQFFRFQLLPNVAANWVAFAAVLLSVVYTMKTVTDILKSTDPGTVVVALMFISAVALMMGLMNGLMNEYAKDLTSSPALMMLSLAASLWVLVQVMKSLEHISWGSIGKLTVLTLMVTVFSTITALALNFTHYAKSIKAMGVMFVLLSLAINLMVPPLIALSLVPWNRLLAAAGAISLIMVSFAGALWLMDRTFGSRTKGLTVFTGEMTDSTASLKTVSSVLLSVSVAVLAIANALSLLKDQNLGQMMSSVLAIVTLLAAFSVLGYLIGNFQIFAKGMLGLGVVLVVIGAGLYLVAKAAAVLADALKTLADKSIDAKSAGKNLAEGLIAFFDELMAHGQSILKFAEYLITGIIGIILAKKGLLIGAGRTMLSAFTGWFATHGVARVLLILAVAIAAIIVFFNDSAPAIVSALVAIVVNIINALALAIAENGNALIVAIINLAEVVATVLIRSLLTILTSIIDGLIYPTGLRFTLFDGLVERLDNHMSEVIALIRNNASETSKVISRGGQAIKDKGKEYLGKSEEAAKDIQKGQQKVAKAMEPPVTKNGAVVSTPVATVDSFTDTETGGTSTSGGVPRNAQGLTYKEWEEKVKTPLETEQKILQDMLEDGTLSKEKAVAYRARLKEIEEILTGGFTTYSDYIRQELGDPATEEALKTKKRRLLEMLDSDIVSEAKKEKIREQLRELRDIDIDDEGETSSSYLSGFDFAEQLGSGITDGVAGFDVQSIFGEFSSDMLGYIGNMATEEREAYISNLDISDEQKEAIRANWRSVLEEPEPEPGLGSRPQGGRTISVTGSATVDTAATRRRDEAIKRMMAEHYSAYGPEGLETPETMPLTDWIAQDADGFMELMQSLQIATADSFSGFLEFLEWLIPTTPLDLEGPIYNVDGDIIGYESAETPEHAWERTFTELYEAAQTSGKGEDWAAVSECVQQGLADGLIDFSKLPVEAAGKTGLALANEIANVLGIASPSKVTAEQGRFVDKGLALGIQQNAGVVKSPIQRMINSMISIIRSARDRFYQVGGYLMKGLAQGIADTQGEVEKVAADATDGIVKVVREHSGVQSPSTIFAEIGMYCGLGYVQGLLSMSGEAEDAARNMVLASMNGTKDALRLITSAIESDVEMDPTIRPVLDLSNLRYGAAQASSLMSRTFSTKLGYAAASMAGGEFRGAKASIANARNERVNSYNSNFRELRADIHELKDAMNEMQIVMDTGALVGSIQKPMDRALGRGMQYSNRRL